MQLNKRAGIVTHLSLSGDIKIKVACSKWKGQLLIYFCKVLVILSVVTLQIFVLESLSNARCLSEPNTQNWRTWNLVLFSKKYTRLFFLFSTKFCFKSFSCGISQLLFCELHQLLHAWLWPVVNFHVILCSIQVRETQALILAPTRELAVQIQKVGGALQSLSGNLARPGASALVIL